MIVATWIAITITSCNIRNSDRYRHLKFWDQPVYTQHSNEVITSCSRLHHDHHALGDKPIVVFLLGRKEEHLFLC